MRIELTIKMLRESPIKWLKDENYVVNLIRLFGLADNLKISPYGEDNIYINNPGIYQVPEQWSKLLIFLSDFKLESYLEIGVFNGGNYLFTREYLKRFNPDIETFGLDIDHQYLNSDIQKLVTGLVIGTSETNKGKQFDFVFIDAMHTYEWVTKDWQNIGQYAKICAFHDINDKTLPDMARFWNELKKDKNYIEFLDKDIFGIGLTMA